MNTVTKMILISEDQYRKKCTEEKSELLPLLNSNLSDDLKVRFVNEMVARKSKELPMQQENSFRPMLQNDEIPNVSPSFFGSLQESTIEAPPASESESERYESIPVAEPTLSAEGIGNNSVTAVRLKAGLIHIKGLFNHSLKVMDRGEPMPRSDIEKIVKYLISDGDGTGIAPPGTKVVVNAILKNKRLVKYIRNPKVKTNLPVNDLYRSWITASQAMKAKTRLSSRMSTSTPRRRDR